MGPEEKKKEVKRRELNSFAVLDFLSSIFLFLFFLSEKPPSIYLAF